MNEAFETWWKDRQAEVPSLGIEHKVIALLAYEEATPTKGETIAREGRIRMDTRRDTLIKLRDEIKQEFSWHYLGKTVAKFINDKLESEGCL